MGKPRDGQVRDFGPGPGLEASERLPQVAEIAANDGHGAGSSRSSALPPDTLAIIEQVPIPVNQSARTRAGAWRLHFAERWRPGSNPLTGWAGGGDPLAQIELRFPSAEAAEHYCRRKGIRFERLGSASSRPSVTPCLTGEAPPKLCCSPTGPHAMCCGNFPVASPRAAQRPAGELN
jgi:hypothetical protein